MLSCNVGLCSCSSVCFLSSLLLDLVSAGVGVISLCQTSDCFLGLGPSGKCVVPSESESLEWPMVASFVSTAPFALFLLCAQGNSPQCLFWCSVFSAALLSSLSVFTPGALIFSFSPVNDDLCSLKVMHVGTILARGRLMMPSLH